MKKYIYVNKETNNVLVEGSFQECENARVHHGYNNFEVRAKKNYFTFFEKTILEGIDLQDYESKELNDYEKIKLVYDIFKAEYLNSHNIHKYGSEKNIFCEWLRGLPSCFNVSYMSHDILSEAREFGYIFGTEEKEDDFLENYFSNLSSAFFTLKDNL